MTGVVIEVDDAAAKGMLGRLATLAGDPAPALRDIGQQLVTNTLLRFEAGRAPGGAAWKPSYRAQHEGGQTLVQRGRLRQSINAQVAGNTLLVGTNVIYAAIHQFGGTIRAKTAKGLRFRLPWLRSKTDDGFRIVQSVRIPARPFLGFDAEDQAATLDILQRHIARAAGGAA